MPSGNQAEPQSKQTNENKRWLKIIWYWTKVSLFIAVGILAEDYLSKNDYWIEWRYRTFQCLQSLSPRQAQAERTVLVLIGDDEYWHELGGRVPIKRDYLANLVQAVDSANPAVIAIDFNLSSPFPSGPPFEEPQFQDETNKFLNTVKAVSQHRNIILPKSIQKGKEQDYESYPDIYESFDFGGGKVRTGYIAFPHGDMRKVPLLSLLLRSGEPPVDSFSQAMARSFNAAVLKGVHESYSLPYGSYINTEEFPTVKASDVLKRDQGSLDKIANKIAIVSGNWHRDGFNHGPLIDEHLTPIGEIPGAFIHANYAEAILDRRIFRPLEGWPLIALEVVLSFLLATAFYLEIRSTRKVMLIIFICVIYIVLSYLALMLLGWFLDFFIPVVLIILHGVYEQIHEWRKGTLRSQGS